MQTADQLQTIWKSRGDSRGAVCTNKLKHSSMLARVVCLRCLSDRIQFMVVEDRNQYSGLLRRRRLTSGSRGFWSCKFRAMLLSLCSSLDLYAHEYTGCQGVIWHRLGGRCAYCGSSHTWRSRHGGEHEALGCQKKVFSTSKQPSPQNCESFYFISRSLQQISRESLKSKEARQIKTIVAEDARAGRVLKKLDGALGTCNQQGLQAG